MTYLQSIIKGCISNNSKSQKALYNKYYAYAFKTAFRYIYLYERVADVVNNSFAKLFMNNRAFIGIDENNTEPHLLALIKRTTINTAIDELRRSRFMADTGSNPEQIWEEPINSNNAVKTKLFKDLICYVKSLPPLYRIVYNMYVIDGFSHNEIEDQLCISAGTSTSNLHKAKVYLEKLIKKEHLPQYVK